MDFDMQYKIIKTMIDLSEVIGSECAEIINKKCIKIAKPLAVSTKRTTDEWQQCLLLQAKEMAILGHSKEYILSEIDKYKILEC